MRDVRDKKGKNLAQAEKMICTQVLHIQNELINEPINEPPSNRQTAEINVKTLKTTRFSEKSIALS